MGRLIIDDTTIYELDEECMEQKRRENKAIEAAKESPARDRAFIRNKVKERPAL